jgi:hypothetical protein
MSTVLTYTIILVLSYLIGSIPWGFLIAKFNGIDIREHGSGNIGATNVLRTLGKKWGIPCFILDFVKGTASNVVKRAYQAVKEARDKSKSMIKNGTTGLDAYNVALETLNNFGFETGTKDGVAFGFIHGLGHGVGLEIHEAPRVSPANKNGLSSGNVITVEPGLYYPEWGGIRLEDIGVVRDDHFECFNSFPTELEIP